MIGWEEAQARILALGAPVEVETVPLAEAVARWAAADIVSKRTQPARDLSAMDGYAIRFADLPGPWRVIGESAAGRPFDSAAASGEAVRIFTGAGVPEGADTIVIQEEVERDGDRLVLTGDGPPHEGAHIRVAGSDFRVGDVVVGAGEELAPPRIALAALGGHGAIPVPRKVRVALFSTGDELVPPGTDAGDDRLPGSNGPMIAAMLAKLPVELHDLGIVPDNAEALAAALDAARSADIVVATGGASVGDHDLVRPALLAAGATLDFWKIAMRPGKPVMAGRLGGAVVLGLPGNPVSAFVTTTLFVLPLIRHLSGAHAAIPGRIAATLAGPLPPVGPRTDFVRARWQTGRLLPLPSTDSAVLTSLAQADALIIRPDGSPTASEGAAVEALLL